jgi:alcohol dehydrogenase class IV
VTPFLYTSAPARVVFGSGTIAKIGDEADLLGMDRILVLSTPGQYARAEAVAGALGHRAIGIYAEAAQHTPVTVTARALETVASLRVGGLVAVGGGSTTGLSKAIAYRTDLPQLIVPTTYAGSEATAILGQTEDGRKTTLSDRRVLPEAILYDVDLTLDLPAPISGTSGLNAMAHAVEALYAPDGNPVVSLLATSGLAAMARALPRIATAPDDREARSDALYGAWLCGVCLGAATMGLHHKLCHVIGGRFELSHAGTHAVILPHVMQFNAAAAPEAAQHVAAALDTTSAAIGLFNLTEKVAAPRSLHELGMPESGISDVVALTMASPYRNPRTFSADDVYRIVQSAWRGEAG